MGDKTQLLICGLATKYHPFKILLGVAIGTLFSHGLAILLGSYISNFEVISTWFKLLAYLSFILFGIYSLIKKEKEDTPEKKQIIKGIVLSVALAIFIGELGDKTQLASIALSLTYHKQILSLILGAIFGMILADRNCHHDWHFFKQETPSKNDSKHIGRRISIIWNPWTYSSNNRIP